MLTTSCLTSSLGCVVLKIHLKRLVHLNCACVLFMFVVCLFVFFMKEEVLAPPPENDDVVNDFDIEEEVIEVENRLDVFVGLFCYLFFLMCL